MADNVTEILKGSLNKDQALLRAIEKLTEQEIRIGYNEEAITRLIKTVDEHLRTCKETSEQNAVTRSDVKRHERQWTWFQNGMIVTALMSIGALIAAIWSLVLNMITKK
jgi:hypothetical protein